VTASDLHEWMSVTNHRVADMLREAQNGDQVYRIEMIQSHEPILHD